MSSGRGRRLPSRLWRAALWTVVAALGLGLGGFLFAASGLYNVAASRDHLAITTLFLEFAMRRSVETHSLGIDGPPLDDPDLVRLGAGHFAAGCAPCHGAPGEARAAVVEHMLPPPPSLRNAARHWPPEELFWIVKNGLKYTGMPAWPAQQRADEVWAMVAFLHALPDMPPDEYDALTGDGAPGSDDEAGQSLAELGAAGCVVCHGDADTPPASRLVPKLAGQSAAYLENALRSYAAGTRASGIMKPAAAALSDAAIDRIAARYAAMAGTGSTNAISTEPTVAGAATRQIEGGRRIAMSGIPESGIPPCLACHSGRTAATFPRLAGQHARYIAGQLRLWQQGLRDGTAHGAIMAPIARRLTAEQIDEVAAYFASLAAGPALRDAGAESAR